MLLQPFEKDEFVKSSGLRAYLGCQIYCIDLTRVHFVYAAKPSLREFGSLLVDERDLMFLLPVAFRTHMRRSVLPVTPVVSCMVGVVASSGADGLITFVSQEQRIFWRASITFPLEVSLEQLILDCFTRLPNQLG